MARLYRRDVRRIVQKNVIGVSVAQLRAAHVQSAISGLALIPLDTRYRALTREAWDAVLEYSNLDKKQYKSQHYDCDNFAMALCGQVPTLFDVNGVGLVIDYSGRHAYNVLIVSDGADSIELITVEPQTDRWAVAQSGNSMYSADNGYILFC